MKKRGLLLLLLPVLLLASTAQALEATAGWTESDLGLADKGHGFFLGVRDRWPLGEGLFHFSAAGEYVQKAGSLSRYFTDEIHGLRLVESKVRLHCAQAAGFLELGLPRPSFQPTVYTGASVVLKLKEAWNDPGGQAGDDYGFEDLDLQIHVGLLVKISRLMVDARYSTGLMEQLVYRTAGIGSANKAQTPELPAEGAKISSFQLGLGLSF